MSTIRIEGAEELIKKLTSLEQMNKVRGAIFEAASLLKDKIVDYPTVSRRPNWMLSGDSDRARRMRAGFFYHLNKGDIQVPYIRGKSKGSENLDKKWAISMGLNGWSATIGNSASYAQLVQDSAKQTSYHRHTGWVTTKQVKLLYGKQAVNLVKQALHNEVNS